MKPSRLAARAVQQLCLVDWSSFSQFDEIEFRDSKVMFVKIALVYGLHPHRYSFYQYSGIGADNK
jgi:hypothetical protein